MRNNLTLKIEDIRINNVFILSMPIDRGRTSHRYYHDIVYKIAEKKNYDIVVLFNEEFEDYRQVKIDKIKPARISDYIVQLKYPQISGSPIFMQEGENIEFELDKYDLGDNLILVNKGDSYWEIENKITNPPQIEFLHELQNCVYHLENTELEINIKVTI